MMKTCASRPRLAPLAVALLGAVLVNGVQAQGRPAAGNPLDQLPVPAAGPSTSPKPLQVDVQTPEGAAASRLEQTIRPSRFDIEGVEAIPFEQVARLFAPLVNKPVTIKQLVAIATEATALYRSRGNPLSFVFVPAQTFDNGVVRIVAVEGYITSVRIEGDAGPAEAKLREIAQALVGERPLRMATFERVSQLLTRVPGITVTADASLPGTTDGATALVLKVKRQPYNVALNADLRQPTPRAILTGVLNDPVFAGSQLNASTALGDFKQETLYAVSYTQLLGGDGLMGKASYTDYRGYPDKKSRKGSVIERFNVNRRAEVSLSYPLVLNARGSLTLEGGAYATDNADTYTVPQNGVTLRDATRVRALFSQLSWIDATPTRVRTANATLAHGLKAAGAAAYQVSNTAGVAGINPARLDFTRIALDASQRDRFANGWGTALLVGGQYSGNTLPASERTSFGGARFGRGYAPGDGVGDSGIGVGVELNRQIKVDAGKWLQQVEPYVLLEAAEVHTNAGSTIPKHLRSAALGMRITDGKHYSVDIAVAKPLGDAAVNNPGRSPRASLLLTYQLGNS